MIPVTDVARLTHINKDGNSWGKHTCLLCGRHLTEECTVGIVIPTKEARENFPRIWGKGNKVAHESELQAICSELNSREQVLEFIAKKGCRPVEKMSAEQKARAELFTRVGWKMGFHDCKVTKTGTTCKKCGSSETLVYDAFMDTISFKDRKKSFMFKGYIIREIETKAYNVFHEMIGDGMHREYNAINEINNTVSKVKESVDEMFR